MRNQSGGLIITENSENDVILCHYKYGGKNMKITICGAGRGGKTMAADFTLMGHEVTLYESPQFEKSLDQIRSNGGSITLEGDCAAGKNGKARIYKLTTDAEESLSEAELVFTVLPGFGHELMYNTIIPHLNDGQIIV